MENENHDRRGIDSSPRAGFIVNSDTLFIRGMNHVCTENFTKTK